MDNDRVIQGEQVNAEHDLSISGSVDASIAFPTNSATNLDFTSAVVEYTFTFYSIVGNKLQQGENERSQSWLMHYPSSGT